MFIVSIFADFCWRFISLFSDPEFYRGSTSLSVPLLQGMWIWCTHLSNSSLLPMFPWFYLPFTYDFFTFILPLFITAFTLYRYLLIIKFTYLPMIVIGYLCCNSSISYNLLLNILFPIVSRLIVFCLYAYFTYIS